MCNPNLKSALKLSPVLILPALFFFLLTQPAVGRSSGIFGHSGMQTITCNACHTGGAAPTVTMSGTTQLEAGETYSFTLSIQSNGPNQTAAGFNAAVGDGSGSAVGQFTAGDDSLVNSNATEVTHFGRKSADDSGLTTFTFEYTAPTVSGQYTMFFAGNSVNGGNGQFGDRASAGQLELTVTDPNPTSVELSEFEVVNSAYRIILESVTFLLLITLFLFVGFTSITLSRPVATNFQSCVLITIGNRGYIY